MKEQTKVITVSMIDSHLNRLDALCKKEMRNRSQMIQALIIRATKELKDV